MIQNQYRKFRWQLENTSAVELTICSLFKVMLALAFAFMGFWLLDE
jgi:hypothetical protein